MPVALALARTLAPLAWAQAPAAQRAFADGSSSRIKLKRRGDDPKRSR